MSSLDEKICRNRQDLERHPRGDAGRAEALFNLADSLEDRYLEKGEIADLDEAISLHRLALDLRPEGHSDRSSSLFYLAHCLCERYDIQAILPDLQESIMLGRAALELRPLGHPEHDYTLSNLAGDLRRRYQNLGAYDDLEEAILLYRSVLDLHPAGHSQRSSSLFNLALCLSDRYDKQAAIPDLQEAIMLGRAALELRPTGHPDHDSTLSNLANDLRRRYQKLDTYGDLEEAISLHRSALDLRPAGHADRSDSLSDLALCLGDRYDAQDMLSDLQEAIMLGRATLELRPLGHPEHAPTLSNLATDLRRRYHKLRANSDLEEAILLNRSALDLRPAGHSDRSDSLFGLALCLSDRYDEQATIPDLQEAITLGRAALELHPPGHPDRALALNNLGSDLRNRYLSLGVNDDLEEAISLHRSALDLRPVGHPDRLTSLTSLSWCLDSRFEKQQMVADLDELISLYCAILDLQPPGHPDHPTSTDKLLLYVQKRLQQPLLGAVSLGKTASVFREPASPDCPTSPYPAMTVHDIVVYVKGLLDGGDVVKDLDEIVNLAQASLKLCPPGHSDHVTCLTTLATSLHRRIQQQDVITDLDELIALYRRVLDACPSGTPAYAPTLHTLARCLSDRFTKLADTTDLDDAIKFEEAALEHSPPGRADLAESLSNLTYYRQLRIKRRIAIPQSAYGPTVRSRIRQLVFEVLKGFPPRLLNTHTGVLCGRDSQMSRFEKSQEYDKLLQSASALDTLPPISHMREVVSTYFQYVTLSHRWGRFEPLLRDIEGRVIYDLDPTDGLLKLQSFCFSSCKHGYLWVWADTCCIDKESSAELHEAIGSMFSWYRQSALTMVYLSDVSEGDALSSSEWFERGWTLQELLASNNILFFKQDWTIYGDGILNHKESSCIIHELEQATGIASQHLIHFYPGVDDARSRLQWASTRCTTRGEDIAYSLLGIFNLHMPVLYGESAENAIGRLLAEVISKSGDTSILDWVGQPSSFHSCFPATLTPYQTLPPSQLLSADARPWTHMPYIWNLFVPTSLHAARRMHHALSSLPRTQFFNFRLVLPCIVYRVQAITLIRVETSTVTHVYQIQAVGLEPIQIALSEGLRNPSRIGVPYVLIRPWHSTLLDPTVETDDVSARQWLTRLEQPFRALLLMALPHNEYRRVASFCNITAHPTDSAGVLKGEVSTLTIV